MRQYTIDQLALMPEPEAVRTHLAQKNYGFLVFTWPIATVTFFGMFIAAAVSGRLWHLNIATAALAALVLMFFFRSHEGFERSFDAIFFAWVILVPLGIAWLSDSNEFRHIFLSAIAPMFLLMVRMRPRRLLVVSFVFIVVAITSGYADQAELGADVIMPPIMTNMMFAGTSMLITRRRRLSFVADWTRASRRELERERMKEELADARKIQLAMLPAAPPDIAWLDISAISVPATEVGGDFYEYFKLDDERVVITIGDVAGHGVGSGLVLAGIKSGLHLLREELVHPVGAVRRLNRVASEWLQWRMLVTLLIAVVDRAENVVRVVCAGHPPLLLVRDGKCYEVGRPALPLGTKLDPVFDEATIELRSGDTLLAYTDGVTELQNQEGRMYDARLEEVFLEAATKHSTAAEIRETILSDIAWFKDKAQQLDDLSLVVAHLR